MRSRRPSAGRRHDEGIAGDEAVLGDRGLGGRVPAVARLRALNLLQCGAILVCVPPEDGPERLIGRHREWRAASEILARVAEGVGAVLLVAGEAGIGKTALAEEFYLAARRDGWRTAWATCAHGAALPGLWPWQRILSALEGEDARVAVEVGDPVAARVALFDGIADRLAAASTAAPVLAVIDDAHWADPASLAMLLHAAATVRQARVCVVATYRPEDARAGTALGEVLAGLRRTATELWLGPLATEEVAALATLAADGRDLPDGTSRWLATVTRGNPLFVTELVRLLPSGWTGDVAAFPTPPSVISLMAERLAGLSERAQAMLQTAAVIGTEFDVTTLALALDEPAEAVLDDLQDTTCQAITRDVGPARFAFAHPLFRAALYDGLGLADRTAAHGRVAAVLEAMRSAGGQVEVAALAHHFGRSAPLGNAEAAVRYAVEAAHEALNSGAYETASLRFAQALATLELAPDAASRVELLLGEADAEAAAGHRTRALELYERAGQLAAAEGDLAALARAALGRSGGAGMEVVVDETAMAMIDRALTLLGDSAPALRARLLARLSVALAPSGAVPHRAALVAAALELAGASGSEVARADADIAWCHLHAGPSHVMERIERARRVVAAAAAVGEVRLELLGRRLEVEALFEAGRFADVDDAVTQYATRAQLVREPAYTFFAPLWRATLAAARGDDRRYRRERAALETLIRDEPEEGNARLLADVQELFHRLDNEGDATGALAIFDRVNGGGPAALDPQFAVSYALVLAAAGAPDEARRLVDTSASVVRSLPHDAEWLPALVQLVDLAALVGPHGLLPWAVEMLAPAAEVWAVEGIGAAVRGPAARALALGAAILGDGEAADRYATQAELLAVGSGVVPWPTHRARPVAVTGPRQPSRATLRREADGWFVDFGGRRAFIRHSKGIGDIAYLLARPGVEVAALELVAEGGASVLAVEPGSALDAKARAAYQRRLAELDAELDHADAAGDARRSAALAAEREMLVAELRRAFGLGGRARRTGSTGERARTAVTTRIRDALKRLEAVHPEAAAHLRRSVRTGTFCAYQPEADVQWDVSVAG